MVWVKQMSDTKSLFVQKSIRLALVINTPAPYRAMVFDRVAGTTGIEFHAFYCAEREPDSRWTRPEMTHAHTYLKPCMYVRNGRFIHNNTDIWKRLKEFAPDVVITTGYNPTQLYAVAYALMHRIQHVPMSAATDAVETPRAAVYLGLRRFVLQHSRAFIATGAGGRNLFKQVGVPEHRVHLAPDVLSLNAAAQQTSPESASQGIEAAVRMAVAPHVLCVQRRLTHYRVPFFEQLRVALAKDGVEFDLVHGQPNQGEVAKNDSGAISWAIQVPNHYFFNGALCWQNPRHLASNVDLLVLTHENKLLFNLWAMFRRIPARLAYWGHGRNFQSGKGSSFKERFKRWSALHADWWFAYTALSVDAVRAAGVPAQCITNLENSIDTTRLAQQCADVTDSDILAWRARHALEAATIGVFVGSLYEEKLIPFLLDAAGEIAKRIPGFVLVLAGDGPDRKCIEEALPHAPWLRYVGVVSGAEKAVLLRAAKVFLNPGLVGLGILDGFVAGIPLVSTECGMHSPEIAYLVHHKNGLMVSPDLEQFVQAVVKVLSDHNLYASLSAGAKQSGRHYTIENMVCNFQQGIHAALQLPSRRLT